MCQIFYFSVHQLLWTQHFVKRFYIFPGQWGPDTWSLLFFFPCALQFESSQLPLPPNLPSKLPTSFFCASKKFTRDVSCFTSIDKTMHIFVLCLKSVRTKLNNPGAWVVTGHVGGWRIAGYLSLWQVCLWINRGPWTISTTQMCYVWLAFILAEGVNCTWVMCFYNGDSAKPGEIPQYVALHWYRELYQCWLLFLPYSWD
jgi:hypothetical protein